MSKTFDALMKAEAIKQQQDIVQKPPDQGPHPKRYPPKKLNGSSNMVEEYHRMKLQLQAADSEGTQKTLVFFSSLQGEGTSTVVSSFAKSIACKGETVLLIDANLRHPVLHQVFHLEQKRGLAELLKGKSSLSDVTQKTRTPNLSVITSGSDTANPFSLFDCGAMTAAIAAIKEQAAWVLFDAPPVNSYNDALALAAKTDGAVMVVEAEKTRWEVAQKVRRQLEEGGIRILGAVLNKRQMRIPGWAYRML